MFYKNGTEYGGIPDADLARRSEGEVCWPMNVVVRRRRSSRARIRPGI